MKYIRFLKVPRIQGNTIHATITITSDLGETFLNEDLQLACMLCSADVEGDLYLRKKAQWKAGMRALPISFDITNCDIDWPAQVHVSTKHATQLDQFQRQFNAFDLPDIFSVWSDRLDPTQQITESSRTVERRFGPLSGRPLRMWEETGESIARHLWDGGIALTAYLDRMIALQTDGLPLLEESIGSATYKKLNVLELGCGCGLVGINLAQIIPDCDVILTDMPEAAEIARRNIDCMTPAMCSSATFVALDWEASLPPKLSSRAFDIILVSECTYNTDTIPALVKTLSGVIKRSPKAIVLLATKVRHADEAVFHDLMEQASFVQASRTLLPLPKADSDIGNQEEVEVYIYHDVKNPLPLIHRRDRHQSVVRFWDDTPP